MIFRKRSVQFLCVRFIAAVLMLAAIPECSSANEKPLGKIVPLAELNATGTRSDLLKLAQEGQKTVEIRCGNCRFAAMFTQPRFTSSPGIQDGPRFELQMTDGRRVRIDTTFSVDDKVHSFKLTKSGTQSPHGVLKLGLANSESPGIVRICFYRGALVIDVDNQLVDARELTHFVAAIKSFRVSSLSDINEIKLLELRHISSNGSPETEKRIAAVIQSIGRVRTLAPKEAIAELNRLASMGGMQDELSVCLPAVQFETAMQHRRSGDREKAYLAFEACVASTEDALTIFHSSYFISKYEMAVHCSKSNRPEKARQFYGQAIAALEFGAANNWMLPVACYGMSKLLGDSEQFEEAIEYARRAKSISDSSREDGAPSHDFCVKTRDQLANCLMAQRKLVDAETELQEASKLVGRYPALIGRATTAAVLTSRATLAELQGRPSEANQFRRQALSGLQNPDGSYPINSWDLLYKQAVSEHSMGEFGLARNLFLASLANIKQFGGPTSLDHFIVLSKLVNLYDELNAEAEMRNCVQEMAELHTQAKLAPDSVHTSRLRYAEASLLMREAKWKLAIEKLKEQASINATRGESHLNGYVFLRIAISQRMAGDITSARKSAGRAHELISARNGLPDEITIAAQKELAIHDLLESANTQAVERLLETSITREALAKRVLSYSSTAMGRLWVQRSLASSEDIPGYLMLSGASSRQIYDSVWRSKRLTTRLRHLNVGIDSPAAEELKMCRSRMRALVTANVAAHGAEQLAEFAERAAELEAELADQSDIARKQLAERDLSVSTLLTQLDDDRAVVDFAIVPLPGATPDSGQIPLDVDSAGWRRFYVAFVICPQKDNGSAVEHVVLGDVTKIDAAVTRFARDFNADDGQFLRTNLWNPIESLLKGRKRIYLVPDGVLATVPWNALPAKNADRYLIEDSYILTQIGYAQQIVERNRIQPLNRFRVATLVGDLEFGSRQGNVKKIAEPIVRLGSTRKNSSFRNWPPLHSSKYEIESIAELFRNSTSATVNILTGNDATDVKFSRAAQECSILHVASHAFWASPQDIGLLPVDPRDSLLDALSDESLDLRMTVAVRNPLLLSGLALSAANTPSDGTAINDGIVLSDEISRYNLAGLWLVVLSACDTGTGEQLPGEVVQGLTDAFHRAGARNVVSSLWKVDDEKTAEFMIQLYHFIIRKNEPLDIAVARARLHMLGTDSDSISSSRGTTNSRPSTPPPSVDMVKRRLSPHFWAGFQIHGPGN